MGPFCWASWRRPGCQSRSTHRRSRDSSPCRAGSNQPNSAPVHIRLGGTDYVYLTSSEILRVADGKVVGKLDHPADVAGKERSHGKYFGAHTQSIARGDRIWVAHAGYGGGAERALGGVYAYRLTRDGEKVSGELLWQRDGSNDNFCINLDGEELYIYQRGLSVVNAADGKVLREIGRISHNATTFAVTDRHVILFRGADQPKRTPEPGYRGEGVLSFYDKKTLKKVGEGTLLMDEPTDEVIAKRIARVASDWWEWGASSPTAWGNRIFIRSHDALYCIGDPNAPMALPQK